MVFRLINFLFLFFLISLCPGTLTEVLAQSDGTRPDLLSNGQFVYGPNVKGFDLEDYINTKAHRLKPFYKEIYYKSRYYSVNPRVTLTILELIVKKSPALKKHYFNIDHVNVNEFGDRLEKILKEMTKLFYKRFYSDKTINEDNKSGNAATYAIVTLFPGIDDKVKHKGVIKDIFTHTFSELFPVVDPMDRSNKISAGAGPSDSFFQLPYPEGESWSFNGVHDWSGNSGGADMSSIDYSDGWPAWNVDVSNTWVVSAASGTAEKVSDCWVDVSHSDGWSSRYYHLENVQVSNTAVSNNDRLGNYANTSSEALCNGGSATGPHLHFSILYNGAYYPMNGVNFSYWTVNSGRFPYDYDCTYMFLTRSNELKCPYSDTVYNAGLSTESIPAMNNFALALISLLLLFAGIWKLKNLNPSS